MNNTRFRLSPAWKTSLITGLLVRLGLTLWGILSFLIGIPAEIYKQREIYYYGTKPILEGLNGALWGVWQRWDTIYYLSIAEKGYANGELSVFFPLYPFLGRWISAITGIELLPALCLVSLASALVSFMLLYQIVERIDASLAAPTVVLMAIFPSSFFFWAAYPQSLGMMLLLLAIWAALRNRWVLAAAAGLAAGLTHSTTIPLTVALGILAIGQVWMFISPRLPDQWTAPLTTFFQFSLVQSKKRNWLTWLAALTPILGTGFFLVWRGWMSFPEFTPLLLERWGRTSQFPWVTLLRLPIIFQSTYFAAAGWANLASLILAVVVTIWSVKKLPTWLWCYQLIGLVMLLSQDLVQEVLVGFNRYVLFLFPIYIALAAWTKGHKRLRFYLLVLFSLMQLYLSLLHMQWVWVG